MIGSMHCYWNEVELRSLLKDFKMRDINSFQLTRCRWFDYRVPIFEWHS